MIKIKRKKRLIIISSVILVVLIAAGVFASKKDKKEEYVTAKAEIKNLIQTVSEVGSVKSSREIELSFLTAGKLSSKFVKVGDYVKKGQILAELDYQLLIIQRENAQSSLDIARADLNKLLSGATKEEIAVTEAQAEKARKGYLSSLDNLEKVKKTVEENISQAEKTLADLESSDPSNITTYEQAISSAEKDLKNTKIIYEKDINNYTDSVLSTIDAKLAIANSALDSIDGIINNNDLKDYLSSKNTAILSETRLTYEESLVLLSTAYDSLNLAKQEKTKAKIDKSISDSLACINKVFDSLNYCYSALEESTIGQASLDAYKTSINTQITSLSTGINSVLSAKQNLENSRLNYDSKVSTAENALKQSKVALDNAIISAKNSLATAKTSGSEKISAALANSETNIEAWEVAKKELIRMKSPARPEDVALAKGKISQGESSLNLINKQIEDGMMKSPIDGKIVKESYEVGEQVMVGKSAFSVLGENSLEIEVDISESDIAKIKEGQVVKITLDAFGEDIEFLGNVYFIEPAETIISEVIYYKVKINFLEKGEKISQIKSGMTANVTMIIDEKKDALVIPTRAIINGLNGIKEIKLIKDGNPIKTEVKEGLRGDGGVTEILSGVKEGDEVILSIKK